MWSAWVGVYHSVEWIVYWKKHRVWKSNLETCELPNTNSVDSHSISVQDLLQKLYVASCLNESQKKELTPTLTNYLKYFISRSGKCTLLEYNFTFKPFLQVVRSFRLIPFSVPCVVWSQIRQTLDDGIISISGSSYLNPLTVDVRDGRIPRTCVDAGKINKCTMPDWATFPLIHELLQQFQDSKPVPTIALSSAFLQVAFKLECRKYTTFFFPTQMCHFTRTL
jgi:hypothetical protein